MSEKSAGSSGKDVLYIDVDDEITSIIDKVRGSKQKIVALVLPKRATVLQSIVNMKLLKRAADGHKKNLVLITAEHGLLPLAGTVGLHVARSLHSKPEMPDGPGHAATDDHADIEEADADDEPDSSTAASGYARAKSEDAKIDKNRSIGELAGAAAIDDQIDDDRIDLSNEEDDAPAAAGVFAGKGKKAAKGTDKKLKIPNFNKFRLLIILGSAGVLVLAVLLYVALAVMPKATISIKTDSQAVDGSSVISFKTGDAVTLDTEDGIVPATEQKTTKTASQQVAASGQKNNGEKASGTMKITNCTSSPVTIAAGTGVSAGGFTFIVQSNLALSDGNFTSGGSCKSTGGHIGTVAVVAQSGGANYNVAARSDYNVSGYPGVTGAGSAMAGGTDNIAKIVLQADIDSAKQKLSSADTEGIKQELKTGLTNKGLFAVDATFNTADPQVKTSVNAGDTADNVTVTQTTDYTMLGAEQSDLQKIVQASVKDKIDTTKQKILDYGLDGATVGLQSRNSDGVSVTYQTNVVVGSELNVGSIKTQVAGKKSGEAKDLIKQYPGVTDVEVEYSPFWVSSIPKKTGKITVEVQKPKVSSTSSNASNP
jgi:hypothetical protein